MTRLRRITRLSSRLIRGAVRIALALVVGGITMGLAAVALLPSFGARSMVVTSGSMEPTINTGGLVIVEEVDPERIEVGDVITFNGYSGEGMTTHRVLSRNVVAGRLHFQTQGDANDTPDVDLAPAEGVVGRSALDVPYAGRILSELQRPQVRVIAVGGPALWLFVRNAIALARSTGIRAPVLPRGRRAMTTSGVVLIVLLAVGLGIGHFDMRGSAAVLNDGVTITDNAFSTGTW